MSQTVLTDTFRGTNGDTWSPRWTTRSVGGGSGAVIDINAGAGRMTTGNTGGYACQNQADLRIPPLFDVDVLIRCNLANPIAEQYPGIIVRSSGDWSGHSSLFPLNGVHIEPDPNSARIGLYKEVGGTQTQIGSFVSYTYTAGTAIWMRLRVQGANLKYRQWNTGSTEPSTWQFDTTLTDQELLRSGFVQMYQIQGSAATSRTVYWDALTVTDLRGIARPSVLFGASTAATPTPAVIAGTTTCPAVTVGTGATVTPSVIAPSAVSIPSVTISDNESLTPPVISRTVAISSPTVLTTNDAAVSATVVSGVATIAAATVTTIQTTTVTPAAITTAITMTPSSLTGVYVAARASSRRARPSARVGTTFGRIRYPLGR